MTYGTDPFTNHSDDDPFRLSEEYLLGVLHDCAETLVLSGKIELNEDAAPYRKEGDYPPYSFSYDVPAAVAQQVFREDFIIEKAEMEYSAPHRLGEYPDDQLSTFLSLTLHSQMPETDITVSYTYAVRDDEMIGEVLGEVDVEYSQGEMSLSREKVEPDLQYESDDPRRYNTAIEQMDETCRKMTLDDIEKIQQLTNYIATHPQRE